MEHWLPLFHGKLETLFDYLPGTPLALEHLAEDAAHERFTQIADYYDARQRGAERGRDAALQAAAGGAALSWRSRMERAARDVRRWRRLTPFAVPEAGVIDVGARAGHNFAAERAEPDANVFEAVTQHVLALQAAGKRVAIALWSEGARERMSHVLADHKLHNLTPVASWPQALALAQAGGGAGRARHRIRLRDRRRRHHQRAGHSRRPAGAAAPRARRADNFIAEATSLAPGDLVVHVDHGIGRFAGLQPITAAGAPHDCLEIHYAEGAKLYLPVENVDLLSRYGSEQTKSISIGSAAATGRRARRA